MITIIDAIYEKGVFRPLQAQNWEEYQRVRLHVEPVAEDAGRQWGSYESLLRTFSEMPKEAGIDEAEWARVESDIESEDLASLLKSAEEARTLMSG